MTEDPWKDNYKTITLYGVTMNPNEPMTGVFYAPSPLDLENATVEGYSIDGHLYKVTEDGPVETDRITWDIPGFGHGEITAGDPE